MMFVLSSLLVLIFRVLKGSFMFNLLCRLFIKNSDLVFKESVQIAYVRLYTLLSIIIGFVFILYKVTYGVIYHSITLTSDGLDSITNIIASIVILWGYHASFANPSPKYPFGRGRSPYLINFGISFLLGVASFQLILYSIKSLFKEHFTLHFGTSVFFIIGFSILVNEYLTFFALYIAKKINSTVMKAEAQHRRSDTFLSVLVIFSWLGGIYHLYWIDSLGGIIFALLILKNAYSTAKDSISNLLGNSASPQEIKMITEIAKTAEGVLGIHEIIIHSYGLRKIVSFHIEVNSSLSLKQAHAISDNVEHLLYSKLHYFSITHIDPLDLNNPLLQNIYTFLTQLITKNTLLQDKISDVKDINLMHHHSLEFDIFIKRSLKRKEIIKIIKLLRQEITHNFPTIHVTIPHFKPLFSTTLNPI
jgi:cation diffusion facilitator family transporter